MSEKIDSPHPDDIEMTDPNDESTVKTTGPIKIQFNSVALEDRFTKLTNTLNEVRKTNNFKECLT